MGVKFIENDSIKFLENKLKHKYYNDNKIIHKQMEEYYLMSVLKCERQLTQLSPMDKLIIFRTKLDTILFPYLDNVIISNRVKLFTNNYDIKQYKFDEFELNCFENDVNVFKNTINDLIYKLEKALRKSYGYVYTKSYIGKNKRLELYKLSLSILYDIESNFNRFSLKYKNTIWSLVPYVILLENIKSDLLVIISNINKSINKMLHKTAIFLDKPIKDKLFNLFTRDKIILHSSDLELIKKILPDNQKKKLKKYIELNKKYNKTKNVIIYIDK